MQPQKGSIINRFRKENCELKSAWSCSWQFGLPILLLYPVGFLMAFVGELPWADPCGSRHVTFSGTVFGVPRKADQPFALPVLEEGRALCSRFWDSPWRWWACVFRTRVQKQWRQRLTMKWIYSHWPGLFWLIWIAKIKRKKKPDNTKCWQKHRTTELSLDRNAKNYKVAWLPWETVWQNLG